MSSKQVGKWNLQGVYALAFSFTWGPSSEIPAFQSLLTWTLVWPKFILQEKWGFCPKLVGCCLHSVSWFPYMAVFKKAVSTQSWMVMVIKKGLFCVMVNQLLIATNILKSPLSFSYSYLFFCCHKLFHCMRHSTFSSKLQGFRCLANQASWVAEHLQVLYNIFDMLCETKNWVIFFSCSKLCTLAFFSTFHVSTHWRTYHGQQQNQTYRFYKSLEPVLASSLNCSPILVGRFRSLDFSYVFIVVLSVFLSLQKKLCCLNALCSFSALKGGHISSVSPQITELKMP